MFPLPVQSPFMIHKYRFKGTKSARTFLKEIFRIESEEKHHISFNLWSEKRPVITVMTQTHSARRFDQDIENDRVRIEPGLTLRDIRFAVLLDNLLDSPDNLIARVPDSRESCSTDKAIAWKSLASLLEPVSRSSEEGERKVDASIASGWTSTLRYYTLLLRSWR